MIRLKVDEAALIDRVTKRFEAEGRADDNPEAFKKRLVAYNTQTAPLVEVYKAQGKLTEIDGMAERGPWCRLDRRDPGSASKAKKRIEIRRQMPHARRGAGRLRHKREISG